MARLASPHTPTYRRHKPSGQAVTTLSGRDVYLGKWGTAASKAAYDRVVGEWLARGRTLPVEPSTLTIVELAAGYKRWAKTHYIQNGQLTKTYDTVVYAMRLLGKSAYARTLAGEFGPLALKVFREKLVSRNLSRGYVNQLIAEVRRAFKWAVAQELLPPSVHQSLGCLPGLQRGRSAARETAAIEPIEDAIVQAVLPELPFVVADMVRLQRLTGARPAEICILRPGDVCCEGAVWEYRPQHHKTENKGRQRVIFFGPKAQDVLRPYLLRAADAYCFQPAESEKRRRDAAHEQRTTLPSYGNCPGTNRKRNPKRAPGSRYTTASYRRAIHRACDKADLKAHNERPDVADDERIVPRWSPNRLRHTAGTEIRKRFGLEAAQVALGHSRADVTQIYAERDLSKAAAIMSEVG
ncbi:MAG TPA: site-specific integrase [Pirellulales bacterium]|jgi:integrase|nr:site-specific integrase [Pirellulales bacterium]